MHYVRKYVLPLPYLANNNPDIPYYLFYDKNICFLNGFSSLFSFYKNKLSALDT